MLANTVRSPTPRRLTLNGVLPASICLCRPLIAIKGNVKLKQTKKPKFFVIFLMGKHNYKKIRISSRKQICKQNHFSLLILGIGGFDLLKKMPKNLVTLPF